MPIPISWRPLPAGLRGRSVARGRRAAPQGGTAGGTRDLANRSYLRSRVGDRDEVAHYLDNQQLGQRFNATEPQERIAVWVAARRLKLCNSQLLFCEVLSGMALPPAWPGRLTNEPTSMCNFRCVICPLGIDGLRPGFVELSDRQVGLLLPVLVAPETLGVQASGDRTASLQSGKLANFSTALAVEVDMITNGSLLHRTNADLTLWLHHYLL